MTDPFELPVAVTYRSKRFPSSSARPTTREETGHKKGTKSTETKQKKERTDKVLYPQKASTGRCTQDYTAQTSTIPSLTNLSGPLPCRTGHQLDTPRSLKAPDTTLLEHRVRNQRARPWRVSWQIVSISSLVLVVTIMCVYLRSYLNTDILDRALHEQFREIQAAANKVTDQLSQCEPLSRQVTPLLSSTEASWRQKIAQAVATSGGLEDRYLRQSKKALASGRHSRIDASLAQLLHYSLPRNASVWDVKAHLFVFSEKFETIATEYQEIVSDANSLWSSSYLRTPGKQLDEATRVREEARHCLPVVKQVRAYIQESEHALASIQDRLGIFTAGIQDIIHEATTSNTPNGQIHQFQAVLWQYVQYQNFTYEDFSKHFSLL